MTQKNWYMAFIGEVTHNGARLKIEPLEHMGKDMNSGERKKRMIFDRYILQIKCVSPQSY